MEFTFAELLRGFRQRASLDQRALAGALRVHTNTISGWECGRCRPRYREIVLQLADELLLTPAETDQLLHSADFPSAHASPPPSQPRSMLRPPAPDFAGRAEEIEQLAQALRRAADGQHAAVCAVQGMAGVGKTELAHVIAQRLRTLFPDAQLLLPLQGSSGRPLPVEQALRRLIHSFAPDQRLPEDAESLEQHYRATLHGRRVLILADDALDAPHVRPLLPPPGSALIVTSRLCFALPGMKTLTLGQLSEHEAAALLRAICGRLDEAEARRLARACGCLPLALRISASMLQNDPALDVAGYLAALADEQRRLALLRDPDDQQLDVEASLRLSYAQLDARTQQVFRLLGVMAGDFPTELVAAVAPPPAAPHVKAALHTLLRRNLLMYEPARARWRLHDLVRDFARGEQEARSEWATAMGRYAQAAVQTALAIQELHGAGGAGALAALARFDQERPHLDAARDWLAGRAGQPDSDAMLVQEALATAWVRRLRLPLRQKYLPQLEDACAAARRLGDRNAEGRLLQLRGQSLYYLGETDQAGLVFEQVLAIARELGDRRLEGRTLSNLGSVRSHLGDDRRAISFHEQAQALAQELDDRELEALTLSNLGLAWVCLGEVQHAIRCHRSALALMEELGDQHRRAIALNCLGFDYISAGEAQTAIPLLEQGRAIARALGDRRLEGGLLGNLARAHLDAGDARQAEALATGGLALAQEIGDQHSAGVILGTLARVYAARCAAGEAEAAFEQACGLLRAVGDRSAEAECGWHYGLFLSTQGDNTRALPLLWAAVGYDREIGHSRLAGRVALVAMLEARAAAPGEYALQEEHAVGRPKLPQHPR